MQDDMVLSRLQWGRRGGSCPCRVASACNNVVLETATIFYFSCDVQQVLLYCASTLNPIMPYTHRSREVA